MAEPEGFAWVDGDVVPLAQARVSIVDRGYLLGDGVFETLRAHDGKAFRWDLHRRRLESGLRALAIRTKAGATAQAALNELLEAAKPLGPDLYLRVQVARDAAVREPDEADGDVTAIARRFSPYPATAYRDGVRLATATWRKDPTDPLSRVKHLSYLPYLLARREARRSGADDALILNTHGRPCEASHSNLVAVRLNTVYAPGAEEGALDGVTRHVLLETLRADGFTVLEALAPADLSAADELLVTNTVGGVVPVREVAGMRARFAGGRGAHATRLRAAYDALVTA